MTTKAEVAKAKASLPETTEEHPRHRPPVKIHPPLMALIDVMFTLMLFFLICSSFRQDEGLIAATLPDRAPQGPGPVVPTIEIPIDIRPAGHNGARYTLFASLPGRTRQFEEEYSFAEPGAAPDPRCGEMLFRELEAFRAASGATPELATVKIDAHRGVRWQYVVSAYNQAVRAHFQKIGFSPQL